MFSSLFTPKCGKKEEEKNIRREKNIMKKKMISAVLTAVMSLSVCALPAGVSAKTNPSGQTVNTVLFYVENASGEQILTSQISVKDLESDLESGKIDNTVHNYSLLDRYVTTLHQEAQGFTVGEFVEYAKNKSSVDDMKNANLTFAGKDKIAFWEIDQTGYDDQDTYTYEDLYGVARYNFPLLYKYWNYKTQDYYDPDGVMTRDQVIDYIFQNGQRENFLLSVRAYSERYMGNEKYGTGDFNMENNFSAQGLLDSQRTIRLMKPMTKEELYAAQPTASDTRYWVSHILLNMENAPAVAKQGTVAAPTAVMTEDDENYYIRFSCSTSGATIYYNSNYKSPSYAPTCPYTGSAAVVPKDAFKNGTVTMTAQAVKEGWTDAGVVTLTLTPSGTEQKWNNPYTDVAESNWYYENVKFVTEKGLFDAAAANAFAPNEPMTRQMLVTALYRLSGSPSVLAGTDFKDVPAGAAYADAVAWAYQNGVVKGMSEDTFAPSASITREQIATMFLRYAQATGANTTAAASLSSYTDASSVASYASGAVSWCVGAGLINGTTAVTLSPKGTATRAQVAAMVQRFADYTGGGK